MRRSIPRSLRRRSFAVASVVLLLLALTARSAFASTWSEDGDAGDLPANAQNPLGLDDLSELTGVLDSGADEDLFRICLSGGGTFSATTVDQPGSVIDTQLFLFTSTGAGVYANDDDAVAGETSRSTLPAGDPLTPTAPGVYYLGISAFNGDPLDAEGSEIFPGGFDVVEGPVGDGTVAGWSDFGGETGDYTIALTGARSCSAEDVCAELPPPGAGAILGTEGSDVLPGTDGADVIFALGGNDVVHGLGGDDLIVAGPGNDDLDGGDGNDIVCGGPGNDRLVGGGGNDALSGGDGFDSLAGGLGDDVLSGGAQNDRLNGDAGVNVNDGGPGYDSCANPSTGPGCP